MSRMTKFLKQKCQVAPYSVDDEGVIEHNRFGEIIYKNPIECKCRRERIVKNIQTENGSLLRATACYFLDESLEILADYLIDGNVVITAEEYINEHGKVEGYEVYV